MAENSKIEWCHHTVNLWWGCTEVHAGCDNCYAKILAHRRKPHLKIWGNDAERLLIKSAFKDLEKYQRKAAALNEVHRVFINSMSDIFEKDKPPLINNAGEMITDGVHYYPTFVSALRDELFENISAGKYPNLDLLLLTKRPSNINKMIPDSWKNNPPANVMFGTSPVNPETAAKLIFQLLQVKGRKFLSVEPQLSEIDFYKVSGMWEYETHPWRNAPILTGIDWIIQGGESGHKKRPFDLAWAYLMKEQCDSVNVPYFFKQVDKVQPIPSDLMIRQFPKQFQRL